MAGKILILEDSSQSTYGGGQKISKIVVESIAKEHQVFLADYDYKSLFSQDVAPYIITSIHLKQKKSGSSYSQRFFQGFFFVKNIFALIKFIKRHQIKLLYATTKLTLVSAYVVNRLLKIPFVYHAHMAPGTDKVSRILVSMLKSANVTIAVSGYVKAQLLNIHNDINITVLYNPIEYSLSKPKSIVGKENFNVAFFGSIKYEKGILCLLDAAKLCLRHPLNVSFNIYGDGEILGLVKADAPGNVVFKGHINKVEAELENNVDVLILPSIIPEACPTIILQAMTKAIPVITTNIGGQKELVADGINGYLVNVASAEDIVEVILKMFNSNTDYQAMSLNNLNAASHKPDLKTFKKDILEIIDNSMSASV